MTGHWDVIVVGARVAGASTAMLLARAGLRVLCVDRSRYGADTLSTHALMRAGVFQLHRWGLVPALREAGTPEVRHTVFHYPDESVSVSIRPSDGVDALYAPRRTVIDTLLVDAARAAGATVEFGVEVTQLVGDGGSVTGVTLRPTRGGMERVEYADLVVGADGRDSVIAREVGASVTTGGRHAGAYLYGYWDGLPVAGYEWVYHDGLAAGAIPTNAGQTCVFVGGDARQVAERVERGSARTAFAELLAATPLGPRLAEASPATTIRYARHLPPAYLRSAYGPGWALVGDAGHWLDPLSTHGITGALRDAGFLASAVAQSTPRSGLRVTALSDYQRRRDQISIPMVHITDQLASYVWDQQRVRSLLRELASALTDEVELVAAAENAGLEVDEPIQWRPSSHRRPRSARHRRGLEVT
jgi:2-polyprenyl-6-methoxyphenol hydroxylase-like FAD-dependent oxidoreductase